MEPVRIEQRRNLERALREDFENLGPAEENRLDELITQYLHHRAKQLTGATTKTERDILDLIHLHTRVALLEQVIDKPKQFNLKDMKELFRSTLIVEQNDAAERSKGDPLRAIAALNVSDEERAKLMAGLTEVARDRLRLQIEQAREGA
jgi:hypothetical protein